MKSDINKFLALQTALINEKAKLEARLAEISRVLDSDVSAPSPLPEPATTTTPVRRTFSAATKAKMAKAQKARWAKKKGVAAGKAGAAVASVKPTRKLSEATKAEMRASHQARWAKVAAAKAKTAK